MTELIYKPDGEVLNDFMFGEHSNAYFRLIRGPIGSGKSVACCVEIFRKALEQEPQKDGWRRVRWAIVRATYPELKNTTIKTWLEWFPERKWQAKMNWSAPYTYRMKNDILKLDMEIIFIALASPQDIDKLKSFELTGVFFNECRELPIEVIGEGLSRTGRFPATKDGGATWYGGIADTNAPDEDHWWPIMSGEVEPPEFMTEEERLTLVKPEGWHFYRQPPAMIEIFDSDNVLLGYELNDLRENGKHTTQEYYNKAITGKSKTWIDVNILNRYGALSTGRPVYPEFSEELHLAKRKIEPDDRLPVYVGMDFGLTPAAVIAQRDAFGRWLILKEIVTTNTGAQRFGEMLLRELKMMFPDTTHFYMYGDPAGDARAQTDETTVYQVLRTVGINAYPAPTNDPSIRIETVSRILGKVKGIVINESCKNLLRGFKGGYTYEKKDTPEKNKYSHIHDALQYLLCGAGESRELLHRRGKNEVTMAQKRFNVFSDLSNRLRVDVWKR